MVPPTCSWIIPNDDILTILLTPPPIFAKMLLKNVNDNGNVIRNEMKMVSETGFVAFWTLFLCS